MFLITEYFKDIYFWSSSAVENMSNVGWVWHGHGRYIEICP